MADTDNERDVISEALEAPEQKAKQKAKQKAPPPRRPPPPRPAAQSGDSEEPTVRVRFLIPEGSHRLVNRKKGPDGKPLPDKVFSDDHGLIHAVTEKQARYLIRKTFTVYDDNGNASTKPAFERVTDDEFEDDE